MTMLDYPGTHRHEARQGHPCVYIDKGECFRHEFRRLLAAQDETMIEDDELFDMSWLLQARGVDAELRLTVGAYRAAIAIPTTGAELVAAGDLNGWELLRAECRLSSRLLKSFFRGARRAGPRAPHWTFVVVRDGRVLWLSADVDYSDGRTVATVSLREMPH